MLECGGDLRLWKLGLACTAKEEGSGGGGDPPPRGLGDPFAEKDRESGYGLKGGLDEPRGRGGHAEEMEKGWGWTTKEQSRFGEGLVVSWAPWKSVSCTFYRFKAPGLRARWPRPAKPLSLGFNF